MSREKLERSIETVTRRIPEAEASLRELKALAEQLIGSSPSVFNSRYDAPAEELAARIDILDSVLESIAGARDDQKQRFAAFDRSFQPAPQETENR